MHPYKILIVESSGSGETNSLLNLTNHEPGINKKNLYVKDEAKYEEKYQILINKRENTILKYSKSFIEYPNNMDNVYKN